MPREAPVGRDRRARRQRPEPAPGFGRQIGRAPRVPIGGRASSTAERRGTSATPRVAAARDIRPPRDDRHACRKALGAAARAGIKPALDRAKATIPVGEVAHRTYKGRLVAPGFASRNVFVKVNLSRDKQAAFARLGVAREAFYAVQFVELGTSKLPKQPWLVPAFESTQDAQQAALGKSLGKAITRIAKKRARA